MTFSPRFTLVAIAFAVGAGTTLVLAVKAYAPKSSTLAIDASNAKYAPQVPALLEDERREYSHPPAEAIKISERATQGTWNLDPEVWPDVTLDLDELWHSRAVDNNSWEYLLHSLYILHDLAIAH